MQTKWDELQDALGIRFRTVALLKQAFTHASYRNEHKKPAMEDNERLEFLGDAVLELVVSEFLYKSKPNLPEGELTRLRASIVREASLVKFARLLDFHKFVRLGRGEERSGGRNRPALLADVLEAFIGALYLDQGLQAVVSFLEKHMFSHLTENVIAEDFKTTLQEWVQQNLGRDLRYETVEERGPAHAKEFIVNVSVGTEVMGTGTGRSKKEAEQQAASYALRKLAESQAIGGASGVPEEN